MIGTDNHPHRPVMIHRAPFGSMERFVGVLIEHFAGAFPLWLAPEQVRVLPISEKSYNYGAQVEEQLRQAGYRATLDIRSSKVNARIRDAQIEQIPYMFVVGEREAENGTVAVRDRLISDSGQVLPVMEAIGKLNEEVQSRRIRQVVKSAAPTAAVVGAEATANEY